MDKEMVKVKNITLMVLFFLKENIKMEKGMVKEKNIMTMRPLNLKENILMGKNGMEKDIIKMIMLYMN